MTCTPSGSDLQCQAIRTQYGYCIDPTPYDVTIGSVWVSSNEAVASFVSAGRLHAGSRGEVQIHAAWLANPYVQSVAQDYLMDPGQAPERLAYVSGVVQNAVTKQNLSNATVELLPERGSPQTVQTSAFGEYQFWSFVGNITLRASKPGYATLEMAIVPLTTCYCGGALLGLSPLP